ncbi:MAG: Asp-tRNA(Asn)/Glu-tRNA(Gln) amidotransferase subunit GatC [Fusobacteriaceae bacterium]
MALTREEVLNVAKLSRLEFEEEEIAKFQIDLNNILKYVDELSEVDTDGVKPMVQANHLGNNFREDVVKSSLTQEKSMENSPLKTDGMLVVPKMLGGDN